MSTDNLDLAGLRRIAEAATPGPWGRGFDGEVMRLDAYDREMDEHVTSPDAEADANHIAAFDPPTVLALLDRIKELEAERHKAQRACRTLGKVVEDQARAALDATGLHHLVDETGDGDWGAVWENLAELGERARTAEARLARVTDDSDRQEVRQQRITDRLHKMIEAANAVYERQAFEDRPWNDVATGMYIALAPEATIRAVAADEQTDRPTSWIEWGVAYRQGDGTLFVDEAVNEDDARERVAWSSVYDLVVQRSVGPWSPVAADEQEAGR